MGVNLSIGSTITIIISVMIIIFGIFLLLQINEIKKVLPSPVFGEASIEVSPIESQKGTLFLINALYPAEREEQELRLIIEGKNYREFVELYDDGKHQDKNARDGFYGGFFDSSKADIGRYGIRDENKELASFTVSEGGCERIIGEDKKNVNFVILPSGYLDYEEFKKDAYNLIKGDGNFISIEPYKTNKNKMSFAIINSTRVKCEIGCREIPTIVCCEDKEVFEEASKCHYDSIIVLLNSDEYCGSASSYAKVCAKNSNANLILLHETGHSFGELADEYVYEEDYGSYDIGEIDAINCDKKGCSKWNEVTDGCYKGCSYSNLYRSEEENSIMYKLVPVFNKISAIHLGKLIDDYLLKENEVEKALPSEKSYFVNLNYNNGELQIKNVFLKPIKTNIGYKKSDFKAFIRDEKNEKLFETPLYIPDEIFPLPNSSGKIIKKEKFDFSFLAPYSADAKDLIIYEKDKPVAKTSLAVFSDKCGNDICDEPENHLSCPADCEIKDDFCEASLCDPDCPSQKNCGRNIKFKFWLSIFLITIAVIVILFLFFRKHRRKYKK